MVNKQFPQDKKCLILHRMAMFNFSLWGIKKQPAAFSKCKKKWEELLTYCQEIDAPQIQCVQDVKNIFDSWKSCFNQKVARKNKSGAGPGRPFTDADKILYNLLRENPYHKKKKVGTL